jgi:hypothetical protein
VVQRLRHQARTAQVVKKGLLLPHLLFLEQWNTWTNVSPETTLQGEKGKTWKEWKGTGTDMQEEEDEQTDD